VRGVVGLAALALLTGCGGSSSPYSSASPQEAKRLMIRQLDAKLLSYRWVACLRTGRSFQGAAITRCNVNFGDPHIELYCIVLKEGRLYSDHQDPAIPCGRDNRAPSATIATY
jgi:hypothetical protein